MAVDRDLDVRLTGLEKLVDSGDAIQAHRIHREVETLTKGHISDEHFFHLKLIQAKIAAVEGNHRKALNIGKSLLKSCRDCDNRHWAGRGHVLLSWFFLRLGEYLEAQKHCEAAIHYCRWDIEDKKLEGDAWNNLGIIHKNLGLWEDAERDLRHALDAYADLGDRSLNLRASLNLAVVLRKTGKIDDASSMCREGLHLAVELGDTLHMCRLALETANIGVIRRDAAEASGHADMAWGAAEEKGYRRELVLAYEVAGDVASVRGDQKGALALYSKGLELAGEFAKGGDLECEILRRAGAAGLALGRLADATASVNRALELARTLNDKYEHALCLRLLGQIEIREGLVASGIDHLHESVERLYRLSPWCHEVAASELALGEAYLSRNRESDVTVALEHILIARRGYANSGIGVAVREIDERISSIVDLSPQHGVPRMVKTRGVVRCQDHAIDLGQYGIVTTDERIIGDLACWGASDVRILIEGETGVGKELVARALHRMSRRREEPFSVVDCGGLSQTLAESELFGHVKGSFTGALRDRKGLIEAGHGGTLFLDEVGELTEALQVKLLRVLEEGAVRPVGGTRIRAVDVRLVSATTKDLWQEVEAGRFRRDLYYRLKGVVLRIPSLRERPDDIEVLADHYLEVYCGQYGKAVSLDTSARAALRAYRWPGNVRELKHFVEALVWSSKDGNTVGEECVEELLVDSRAPSGPRGKLRDVELQEIEKALEATGGNKTKAARLLGITRKTLRNKLKLLRRQ